ncbi:MAG TPA: oligoendopeptidase F [Candidatus Deferrimicrobium sp.]|nr:oligoendopeptidase F [Candidatus Deferrimicrobium sp.]
MIRHNVIKAKILACVLILVVSPSVLLDAQTGAIPQRSDIDSRYKWKLDDIFATDQAWETSFASLKGGARLMDSFKGHLGDSAQSLADCLKLTDSLSLINDNLFVYAYMKLDEDNRVSHYQEMADRVSALSSELEEAMSFIRPEILAIEDSKIQSFVAQNPDLSLYRFYLENLLRSKAHILSDKEEALLALAGPVASAPSRIFGMIDDADISYGTIKDDNGNDVELTKQRYYKILESPDRRMRRDASEAYNRAYLRYVNTLAATLAASVKRDYFYMKARGYKSCLEMALDQDNVPLSVFHSLIDAVNANLAPLHKLSSLRKRVLGVDTLYTYDLSVPLVPKIKVDYPYEEARAMVADGLKPMGDEYLRQFENGLNSGWADVFETQGKGSGAYQWGSYSSHPYVLLNHGGTLEDVFTIAHEMGHALHSLYTNRREPYVYHNHSLFVAEVASTCNEAVLLKYMTEHATDPKEKMVLLDHYISQIIGTFFTQVMFSEFELAIHERIESGEALSADYLRQTYRGIYQKYWGPDVTIGEINDLGGLRISHFYRQYYVYQYATSYAAAQMLSQKILEDGDSFLNTYYRFLSTGSSKYPVEILKDAGVDVTTPEPVNRTMALFARLVDELSRLVDKS